jgi:hypothetical protein
MPRKLRLASIAIVVASVVAGCGGSTSTNTSTNTGSGSGSGSVHTAAAKHLVAEADPICKQVDVERTAANTAVANAGSSTSKVLQTLARVAPPVAADERRAVVRLRAIEAPASLASDWQKLLTGIEQLATDATAIGTDAKAGEYKDVTSLTASGRKLREGLTEIATRDGFTYCGVKS